MKIFLTLILLLTFVFNAFAQDKEPIIYQIKNIYQNADLNEKAIDKYRKKNEIHSDTNEILKLFTPIKGKHKVIVFMGSIYGLGFDDKKDIFHSILILKVDKDNEILDGLEYLLEWAEPPHTVRLFRTTKNGVKLQKGLQISQFEFQPFEKGLDREPKGIIDNLYKFQEVF